MVSLWCLSSYLWRIPWFWYEVFDPLCIGYLDNGCSMAGQHGPRTSLRFSRLCSTHFWWYWGTAYCWFYHYIRYYNPIMTPVHIYIYIIYPIFKLTMIWLLPTYLFMTCKKWWEEINIVGFSTLLNLHLWVQWTHLGNFTGLQKSLSISTGWWLSPTPLKNISQLGWWHSPIWWEN